MAKKNPGARKTAPPPDIEVLDAPSSPDQELVSQDTDKLRAFMGGLASFFSRAITLEKQAKERLDIARQLKPPTTADEDATVQVAIREAKLTRKAIDDHWSITTVVHQLHRKLTAARERAGTTADQAASIAQTLHNRYVEDEQRRVRMEEERLRREAEERARVEREAELARLEAEAVRAEQSSPDLSEREKSFVYGLITLGYGPTTAAQKAGFAKPEQAGERLMNTPKIKAALDAKKKAAVIREQASAQSERPLDVAPIEKVQANITRATPGGFDRSTYSAEVFDVEAFMAALLDPRTRTQLGIPADIATFQQTKLNDAARGLGDLINKWPGVRLKKKTTTV